MRAHLRSLLAGALRTLQDAGELAPAGEVPDPSSIPLERCRDARHGHFASPLAMGLARAAGRKPRELAERVVASMPASEAVERIEIAGPGFINFFLTRGAFQALVPEIRAAGDAWGRSTVGAGTRVQVEFVSSNPTGPLHVGHGRGAACGDAVAELLAAAGFEVQREYYVNDAGRQMDILTVSVWLRYLEHAGGPGGESRGFPANGYRGGYVRDIAAGLRDAHGDDLQPSEPAAVWADLPADAPEGDAESYLSALIARAESLLGAQRYRRVLEFARAAMIDEMRQDLEEFGVVFDRWFSERSLMDDGSIARTIEELRAARHVYEREGALWFRSTAFGDEKDRVVVRENGVTTYFASDIAYHHGKFDRGFDRVIDVWGADHHGYIARVKAALAALGHDPERFEVLLVQFANLYRGGEKVAMSTRAGEFVTLRELRREVGRDAARFFYVLRKSDQHLDFDLDLARSQSSDNPVYYVQYAHARICSVVRQLGEKGYSWRPGDGEAQLGRLVEPHELGLLNTLSRFPEVVEAAALAREPHQVAFYLREVATDFHTYYNTHTFLVEEKRLRDARLDLIDATRQVIRNGLGLLGVSAPEAM